MMAPPVKSPNQQQLDAFDTIMLDAISGVVDTMRANHNADPVCSIAMLAIACFSHLDNIDKEATNAFFEATLAEGNPGLSPEAARALQDSKYGAMIKLATLARLKFGPTEGRA